VGGYTVAGCGELTLNGTEESLCITSDAKVGVGIANPQRALEVAGDLVVSGTISGGAGMGVFRNRIINGDMRIAQRGTSFTSGGYGIDRWDVTNPTVVSTFSQNSLAAGDAPATQSGLQYYMRVATLGQQTIGDWTQAGSQRIEGLNTVDLNWGTSYGSPITVSFWYRSTIPGNHYFEISNNVFGSETYIYFALFAVNASTWQYYTFTIPPPPNGSSWVTTSSTGLKIAFMKRGYAITGKVSSDFSWQAVSGANFKTFLPAGNVVNFYGQAGSVDITGVQIEKGTVATPFEFRPYATELQLCQRYYQVIGQNQGATTYFGTAFAYTTSAAYLALPLGVSMRTAPTTVTSNVASAYKILVTGIGGVVVSSITLTGTSSQTAGLNIGTGAVLTAGQGVLFYTDNPTTTLGFNAEL
jgi:hypothetical protein